MTNPTLCKKMAVAKLMIAGMHITESAMGVMPPCGRQTLPLSYSLDDDSSLCIVIPMTVVFGAAMKAAGALGGFWGFGVTSFLPDCSLYINIK